MDFARSSHPDVQAQLDRLAKLSPGGDMLGLDRITRLLDRLDRPQDSLPPVFHVAGTNGKGSTCAFLRSALEAAGLAVHVFTSPHLVRFNERIRVAGGLIDDELLATLLEEVLDVSTGIDPSFFEVTTAAAFLAFARRPADACVIEVGLGGRLDATNVIARPLVCAIANLGIDHQQWLGATAGEIAREKAGIAKAGVPLVTQRYPPLVAQQIHQAAERAGASWIARGAMWDARVIANHFHYRDRAGGLKLPMPALPGRHQADNAALAVAMLRHQDRLRVDDQAICAGVTSASWPGRLQRLEPGPLTNALPDGSEMWIDGAHNGAAARLVADHVGREFSPDLPLALVFGCLRNKDAKALLRPFAGMARDVHAVPIAGHDCHTADDLRRLAESLDFQATANDSLEAALRQVREPARVLVVGSLYLAGEALSTNAQAPD